jgi:hypothetical protein
MSKVKSYQLTGQPLFDYAKNLGIPIYDTQLSNHSWDEEEIRRRIFNVERSRREHRLWIVALGSAIASAISAAAAWTAIFFRQ